MKYFLELIVVIALIGYFLSIKMTVREKEIRKSKIDYQCFRCKEKFSVNEVKCPKCEFVTLYGERKKKFWTIIPIIIISIFMFSKFGRLGMLG